MRANYENPAIRKAFGVLEALSADKETRRLAEMRENALRNERSELAAAKSEGIVEGKKEGIVEGKKEGIVEGIAEGKKEGIAETARTLLRMGILSIDQIAEATGLSVKEIRELQGTGK